MRNLLLGTLMCLTLFACKKENYSPAVTTFWLTGKWSRTVLIDSSLTLVGTHVSGNAATDYTVSDFSDNLAARHPDTLSIQPSLTGTSSAYGNFTYMVSPAVIFFTKDNEGLKMIRLSDTQLEITTRVVTSSKAYAINYTYTKL